MGGTPGRRTGGGERIRVLNLTFCKKPFDIDAASNCTFASEEVIFVKIRWIYPMIALLLLPVLSGCGRRGLDAGTLNLVESGDAVCLGRFEPGSTWYLQLVRAPEGVELEGVETSDGTRWVRMLRIHLTADYLGNLTLRGTDLDRFSPYWYIFVLVEGDYRDVYSLQDYTGRTDLLLFLDIVPGYTHTERVGGKETECLVFTPHGASGLREPADAASLRLL